MAKWPTDAAISPETRTLCVRIERVFVVVAEMEVKAHRVAACACKDDGVVIAPLEVLPFACPTNPSLHYCRLCQRYTDDFYPYLIKTKDRRCKSCLARARREHGKGLATLDKLRNKLKYNLVYHKQNRLARACRREHVAEILQQNGITTEAQLRLVKTISPNFDPVGSKWRYNVVYHVGYQGQE
eukprot:CAMPEP_0184525424 /NCGR_PEP_ID=MMETSP0198_2-20121128/10089_1 /TAXON_ID=1112570 /ORGANISM="Thraustochytrium sp., Strain LLF1b" /LENGTH=183 /DNA_ID=CAMNT_0026916879 /DNA_START=202 /DNA_END=754 /DNA_ORIENTATION=-